MLIYLCHRLDETEVGNSAPCDGTVGDTISECRQGSLIAGWAVGGAVSFVWNNHYYYISFTCLLYELAPYYRVRMQVLSQFALLYILIFKHVHELIMFFICFIYYFIM